MMLNSGLQGSEDKRGRKTNSTACDPDVPPPVTQLILSGLTDTTPCADKSLSRAKVGLQSHTQMARLDTLAHTPPPHTHIHKSTRTSHMHAHMYSHTYNTAHACTGACSHANVCTHAHMHDHTRTNIHPRHCRLRSTITESEDLPTCCPKSPATVSWDL